MQLSIVGLTVSLWSVFEAEGKRERRILLKKLCSKGVPPQAVTFLLKNNNNKKKDSD